MGFLVSQHGQLGAIPPLLSASPFESMRSGGALPPPPQRGISAILAQYHMKTRQKGCDTPLCDTISKGYCAKWGASRTGPLRAKFFFGEVWCKMFWRSLVVAGTFGAEKSSAKTSTQNSHGSYVFFVPPFLSRNSRVLIG